MAVVVTVERPMELFILVFILLAIEKGPFCIIALLLPAMRFPACCMLPVFEKETIVADALERLLETVVNAPPA